MTGTVEALRWDKPGPGAWEHDAGHGSGPTSRAIQELFPAAMAAGFRSFTGRYGLVLSHFEVRYVNGFPYQSPRIAGIPPSDRPAPPPAVLRVVSRLHPVMRRRNRHALAALARRVWAEDLRTWFDDERPKQVAALRALQGIEPDSLDDAALADHVEACAASVAHGLRLHFSLVGASAVPIGLHLTREEGRGRTPGDALGDLTGAAAASTAATVPALQAIADALTAAGVEPTSIEDVRNASPDAAAALAAYLEEHGQRVVGANDVTGRRLVEMPEVILRSIASSRAGHRAPVPPPPGDDLVADARLALASRDDHSGICGSWTVGLLRRAMLEAGRRLEGSGRLAVAQDVFECTAFEVASLLTGGGPSGGVIADRSAARRAVELVVPPAVLGRREPPPDPAVFADGLRTMGEAIDRFLGTMFTDQTRRGVGIGDATYRGRAVVAADADDAFARLADGDVLVTTMTTPAFNSVLPIVGALVTVHGGPMSHAGIVARELGIPAVVGVDDALDRISDGDLVDVDPMAGTVTVVR